MWFIYNNNKVATMIKQNYKKIDFKEKTQQNKTTN